MATSGGEERNYLTIVWRIENLGCFQYGCPLNLIMSPVLCAQNLKKVTTQLTFYPLGRVGTRKNVDLGLWIASCLQINCEFSLLAWEKSPLVTTIGICVPEGKEIQLFTMKDSPTREELFVRKKSLFLPYDTLTVQCRIWKSEGNFPAAEFFSVYSRIESAEVSISRQISDCSVGQNNAFPVQFELIHEKLLFDLEYSLSGNSIQNSELNIKVIANRMRVTYLVVLEVSVLDRNSWEVTKPERNRKFFFPSQTQQVWEVPKFALRNTFSEKNSLMGCGENDTLLFRLFATCSNTSHSIEKMSFGTLDVEQDRGRATFTLKEVSCQTSEESGDNQTHLQPKNNCLNTLVEDFFSLYQKQEFSDFELCSKDVSFPVHKNILCARSPVFNSMFSSGMKESNSNSLEIPDIDAHALNRMLTFLYTGTVEPDLPLESAANLYYAADKYQVESLKSCCSGILQSHISVSKVSEILIIANRHQDSQLTSFVHDFILDHFEDVMNSDEWERFLDIDPVLAGKSTHQLCKKKSSKK